MMQLESRVDGRELSFDHAGIRPGMYRDRTSSISGGTPMTAPPSVSPEPAYIAPSAASQIITTDHETQMSNWFEDGPEKNDLDTAIVSSASLVLVNAFLDQLLFNFLASARSTSIAALRPAVSEVLKPRLAKDAINGADQELEEFLGGGDEEELFAFHNGLEQRGPWDLQLVWRRTRLRCMVYTRLGDMEEEDEEAYVKSERAKADEEGLRRLSRDLGIVSPPAAIFLTSILEFIGEQILMIAGESAYARRELKKQKDPGAIASSSTDEVRVVVEDSDIEKLAFNTTFGRLWRSWKKRVRSPSVLSTRTVSRDFGRGRGSLTPTSRPGSRKASVGEMDEPGQHPGKIISPSVDQILERPSDGDLVPPSPADTHEGNQGLPDAQPYSTTSTPRDIRSRPRSMVLYPHPSPPLSDHNESNSIPQFSSKQRRRSSSLPALQSPLHISPLNEAFFTPISPNHHFASFRQDEGVQATDPAARAAERFEADDTVPTKEVKRDISSTQDLQTWARSDGISKEEFDRRMLAIVRDSEGSRTPESQSADQDSDPKIIPSKLPTATVEKTPSKGIEDVHRHEPSRSEPKIIPGIRETTMKYWLGEDNPEKKASMSDQRVSPKESQGFVAKPTQGGRPRTASGGAVDHDYGRMWEHQAPYFYHDPTASHASQSAKVHVPDGNVDSHHGTQIEGEDSGVPPLTPLRELMEAAHDTSDEASSVAPSHDARRLENVPPERDQDLVRSEAFSSQVGSQAKPTSRFSDLRSKLPAVNTGTERAAVQRVLPSPISAREPLTPVPRTSTSSNRDLRQIQTSSSSTSQVSQKLKGLVGRDSSDARRPTTSRRSSEGSSSLKSDKRSLRTPKADEAQRSFDQLIRSDETIQYTLTPQNMREMEAPDSPRWNSHKRTNTAEMADFFRNTGPEEPQRPWTSHSKRSLKGLNGLAANPINVAKPTEPTRPSPTAPDVVPSTVKATSRPTTSHSHSGVAREARANSESTRDFADFLRSTGPNQDALVEAQAQQQRQQQQKGPSVAAPKPLNALPAASRPVSSPSPKKITKQNPTGTSSQRTQPPPSKTSAMPGEVAGPIPLKHRTPKLQARDATVSRETSADLIDFIRQGPSDRSEGRLRLPRTGDPARPFGDTNGITRGINGRPSESDNPRLSVASTQLSSVPSKSVHSVSSRTGLLEKSSPTRDAMHKASELTESRYGRQEEEAPQPIRKQHRNKDPYAIDTDSEGEESSRAPPQRAEESLIHFLNSVTPPPSPPTARNGFAGNSTSINNHTPQKNHYPSMRDRLTRNGAPSAKQKTASKETPMGMPSITRGKSESRRTAAVSTLNGVSSVVQPVSMPNSSDRGRPETTRPIPRNRSQAPQLPPLNPRETSPHLLSQVKVGKMDPYKITHPTYAAHIDRERNGAARRSPVQHYQARGNREPDHGLSDLADFLKNSEPPAPIRVESPVVKEREKESGFGRMFSRKKKGSQA